MGRKKKRKNKEVKKAEKLIDDAAKKKQDELIKQAAKENAKVENVTEIKEEDDTGKDEEVDTGEVAVEEKVDNNIYTGLETDQEEERPNITTTASIKKREPGIKGPINVKSSEVVIQVVERRTCSIGSREYLFLPGKSYRVPRNVMEILANGGVLKRVY